jgi:hypothetical protein
MNNETHEDRVVVLSEAPEGEFDIVVIHTTNLIEYAQSPDKSTIRSLADIQKLVDMQNEIDRLMNCLRTIENKSCFSIGDYEGVQSVLRDIQVFSIEALTE